VMEARPRVQRSRGQDLSGRRVLTGLRLLRTSWAGDINDKAMITITKTKSGVLHARTTAYPQKKKQKIDYRPLHPQTGCFLGEGAGILQSSSRQGGVSRPTTWMPAERFIK